MLTEQRGRICVRADLAQHDPRDARLKQIETEFLEERVRTLRRVLDTQSRRTDAVGGDASGTAATRRDVLMARRREVQILEDLLHAPERQHRHLECVLGDRLRHADQSVSQMSSLVSFKGRCDEVCWNAKMERQVVAKILADWWRWLRRRAADEVDKHAESTTA